MNQLTEKQNISSLTLASFVVNTYGTVSDATKSSTIDNADISIVNISCYCFNNSFYWVQ